MIAVRRKPLRPSLKLILIAWAHGQTTAQPVLQACPMGTFLVLKKASPWRQSEASIVFKQNWRIQVLKSGIALLEGEVIDVL